MSVENKDKPAIEPFDDFEAEWMRDIEEDRTTRDIEAEKRLLGKMVVSPEMKKTHPVSIRITDADLEGIQIRAAKVGMPYQTLIKSVLHKIATNQIDI